jgi:DNA-binding HxlR family transcriptional regulator
MYRLVINNRLVMTTIKILSSLYKKNMFVNEIIDQTSSDRSFVIKTLRTLEKGKFITSINSKSHKQKKVKQLSQLGQELANLVYSIHNFNEKYDRLAQLIDEYKKLDEEIEKFKKNERKDKSSRFINRNPLEIKPKEYKISERLLKEKLRIKDWTTEEISYYYECQEGLYYTDIFLHEGTIKILLHKFISILDNFDLNVVAREILNQIIIQIFQAKLSNIVTNIHAKYTTSLKKKYKNNKINYSQYYPNFNYEPLDYIDKLRFPFSLSVMETVENMMICYLNLLKPSKEIIELKLKAIKNDIKNAPSYEINDDDTNRERLMMSSRCLTNAYAEYLNSN